MAEAAFSDTTFQNDRQKAEAHVVKKDKDTGNGLAAFDSMIVMGTKITVKRKIAGYLS